MKYVLLESTIYNGIVGYEQDGGLFSTVTGNISIYCSDEVMFVDNEAEIGPIAFLKSGQTLELDATGEVIFKENVATSPNGRCGLVAADDATIVLSVNESVHFIGNLPEVRRYWKVRVNISRQKYRP